MKKMILILLMTIAPLTGFAETARSLSPKYTEGDTTPYKMEIEITGNQTIIKPQDAHVVWDLKVLSNVDVKAVSVAPDGTTELKATLLNPKVVGTLKSLQKEVVVFSQNFDSKNEGRDIIDQMITQIAEAFEGLSLNFTLDQNGKIASVNHLPQAYASIEDRLSALIPVETIRQCSVNFDAISLWLKQFTEYLPEKAVAVGDSWEHRYPEELIKGVTTKWKFVGQNSEGVLLQSSRDFTQEELLASSQGDLKNTVNDLKGSRKSIVVLDSKTGILKSMKEEYALSLGLTLAEPVSTETETDVSINVSLIKQ